ncbi:2585_t:CDS:1, partial [Gigaspora margarita]
YRAYKQTEIDLLFLEGIEEHVIGKHKTYTIPDTEPKQNITEKNNTDIEKLFQKAIIDTILTKNNMKTNEPPDQFRQTTKEIMQKGGNQSGLLVTPGPINNDIRDEL